MGPCFALPLAALACFLLPAGCCVICDSRVTSALKNLETDYLPNFMNPEEVKHMYDRIVKTVKDYHEQLPYSKSSYMGAIDEKRYEMVITSFLKNLKNVTDSKLKGKPGLDKLKEMLRNERMNFVFHVGMFQRFGHCPNKCGLMLQTLIWCDYCSKQNHVCQKPNDCGDRREEVHEHEDLNLNCHLDWHDDSFGLGNYTFYRVWENNSETLLYNGKSAVLNLPSVSEKDAGLYRCVLNTIFQSPSTIMRFHVTVYPRNLEEWRPSGEFSTVKQEEHWDEEETPSPELETIPTTQPVETQNMLKGRINGLIICFIIVLIAAIIFWLLTRKKKKSKSKSSRASFDSKASKISKKTSTKVLNK